MTARLRSAAVLSTLGVDELAALIRFARANGRSWKSRLCDAWASGHDEREDDASALRRIRNRIGPSGLMKFGLSGVEAELAARGEAR